MPLDLTDDTRSAERLMPRQRVFSPETLAMLKSAEGFRARTYDDLRPDVEIGPNTPVYGTLTIGYGHTGRLATPGREIDERTAEDLLIGEIEGFETELRSLVKVPLSQGEYDALVSFLYNVGAANFGRSTLLRRLNIGDYDGAAGEFGRWVYSKGVRLDGLVHRRSAEQAMFRGQVGLVSLLAARAESSFGIGSNVRPDAEEGRGVMKPKRKSKTGWLSGLGLGGMGFGGLSYALDGIARIDPRVLALGAFLLFAAIMINRYLEWKAGEH